MLTCLPGLPPKKVAGPLPVRLYSQERRHSIYHILRPWPVQYLYGCLCVGRQQHSAEDGGDAEDVEGAGPGICRPPARIPTGCRPAHRERPRPSSELGPAGAAARLAERATAPRTEAGRGGALSRDANTARWPTGGCSPARSVSSTACRGAERSSAS